MTDREVKQIKRLAWLCNELIGGNSFSSDALRRWADEANSVLPAEVNARACKREEG